MEAYADAVATYERVGKFYAQPGLLAEGHRGLQADPRDHREARPARSRTGTRTSRRSSRSSTSSSGLTSDALAALDEVATRLQRQNRDQEAIDVFRKIVELDPTNPLPHLRLAEALSRAKDVDGAVARVRHRRRAARRSSAGATTRSRSSSACSTTSPTRARAHRRRAVPRAQAAASDGMQALAKLQICFQANPRDLDTLGLLARAFNQIGQAAKAIEVQKEMARIARDTGKTELFQRARRQAPEARAERRGREAARDGIDDAAARSRPAGAARRRCRRSAASPSPRPSASYEDVGESDIEADEQPLELSRAARRRAPTATSSSTSGYRGRRRGQRAHDRGRIARRRSRAS